MVRFGVVLSVVLVAIGLLATGVVAGSLLLVAISIGVALVAFLLLVGVVISFRREIFGSAAARARQTGGTGAVPAAGGLPAARAVPAPGAVLTAGAASVTRAVPVGRAMPAGRKLAEPAAAGKQGRRPDDHGPPHDSEKAAAAGPRPKAPPQVAARPPAGPVGSAAATRGAAGPGAPGTAAAGGRAATSDRQSPPKAGDRSEPRRGSRLERESARAAAARTPADVPPQPAPVAGQEPVASKGEAARAGREPDRHVAQAPGAAVASAGAADEGKPDKKPAAAEDRRSDAARSATPPGADRQADGSARPPRSPGDAEPSAAFPPAGGKPAEPAGGAAADQPAGAPAGSADDVQVSVVPGITRYHRSDCLLIRFLSADDLEVMTRREAADGGCVPCKACKPDQEAANLSAG